MRIPGARRPFCFLALLGIFCSLTVPAHGDSLSQLKKIQREIAGENHAKQAKEHKQLLSGKWLEAGTNFARLFLSEKGPLNLLDWLGTVIPGFSPGNDASIRETEYVGATKSFRDEELNEFTLLVLVPHPKYSSEVGLGLERRFAENEPPYLKVLSSEKIELRAGYSAVLYAQEEGACSLVIKTVRNSMINLSAKTCALKSTLIDLAQKLDLERLSMKLQS